MVDAGSINSFLDAHGFEVMIAGGALIGFLVLYKKMRATPSQPDFIRIFNERGIRDETLNVINEYEPNFVYRGNQCLGRIVSYDTKKLKYNPTKQEIDTKAGIHGWEAEIATVVFRPKTIWKIYMGAKRILRFKVEEAKIKDRKLIFPSTTGFTALGNEYVTKSSFKEASLLIDTEWSKRLFEANVNVFASKMSHISAETPEMSHELSLKRLEIEKIRAEKQAKVGGLI